MNILEKRPLALILCVMLGGFSLFALLSPLMRALSLGAAISFIAVAFIRKRSLLFKIASSALLISFVASFLYFDIVFYPKDLYEKETELTGKVLDSEIKNDYYQSLEVKVLSVNGESKDFRIILNLYGRGEKIAPGSIISFKTEIKELDEGESFNFKSYYTSRGICASADVTDIEIISVRKAPIGYKFKQIREHISERAERISNKNAGALLSALLLGERDRLSGQLNLDFSRTGITHILALSGTHVVILAAAVDKLLSLFRVGRKYRLFTGCIFTLLFMALTGFPLSVCRAGIMLILSTVLFMITGNKDGITSLLMASALIIVFSPYAALDVGLWLSILATGGLLVCSEMINDKYSDVGGVRKILRSVALSFAFSLFAISATVIVTALSFTGNSILAALATFVFSILTELYVYLGIIVLLLGEFIPVGKILVAFELLISRLIGWFSDFSFAYSSTEFSVVKLLFIALGASFAWFAFASVKRKRTYISALVVLFVFANLLPLGLTARIKSSDAFVFVNDEYDKIIIREDGKSLLYDISDSSKNAAYANNYLLVSERMVEIDTYIVANYYEQLPESIDKVLSSNLVKNVKLPKPNNNFQSEIAIKTYKTVENYRAQLSFYDDSDIIRFADFEITTLFRKDDMVAIVFKKSDEIYSYLSKGALEYVSYSEKLLYVSDYIVFGGYGKSYTKMKIIDEFDKKLKTVVSFDSRIDFDLSSTDWQPPKIYFAKNKFYFYE